MGRPNWDKLAALGKFPKGNVALMQGRINALERENQELKEKLEELLEELEEIEEIEKLDPDNPKNLKEPKKELSNAPKSNINHLRKVLEDPNFKFETVDSINKI